MAHRFRVRSNLRSERYSCAVQTMNANSEPQFHRRRTLPAAVALLVLLGAAASWAVIVRGRAAAPPVPGRPSIVLITLDAIRTERMSCYGYARDTTPNLNELARHSTRFLNATTPMPFTAPAHCTMLTGLYPTTHGVTENGVSLSETLPVLPDLLKRRLYTTGAVVAVRFLSEFGLERGFDWGGGEFGEYTVRRAEEVTARARDWLKRRRAGQPFFLWAHYYDPHEPYRPPAKWQPLLPSDRPLSEAERSELARRLQAELPMEQPPFSNEDPITFWFTQYAYDGEIQYADEQVGVLLRYLQEKKLYDSSLIIVVGDHGEAFGEHPGDIQHGFRLYQATQRVPLLIKLPGQTTSRDVSCVVSLADLVPTLLDVLGEPPLDRVHGLSLLPLLQGKLPPPAHVERDVFMERKRNRPSAAGPTSRLSARLRCFDIEMYALRDQRWKLIWEHESPPQLYDLLADPDEQNNVADAHPERVARMYERLMEQNRRNREQAVGMAEMTQDPKELEMLRILGYLDPPPSEASSTTLEAESARY